jgi:hypothetical protein
MTSARARCLVLVGGLLALALATGEVRAPEAIVASRNISVMVRAPLTQPIVLAEAVSPAGGRRVQLVRAAQGESPR